MSRSEPPVRHVVLVGLMGAGKTTVGRGVAAALGWPFRDSDAEIEATTGHTVRELRDGSGVESMHALEADQLRRALAEPGPSVVSAAASVIEVPDCRELLRGPDVRTIWLRASASVLAGRFASAGHRPAYGDDPAQFLARQARQRDPLFASVGPLVVDVDGLGPNEAVARALELLASAGLPVRGASAGDADR